MEVIIAVAILAVLTGLLAPAMMGQIKKARLAKYRNEAQEVCRAVSLYLMDLDAEGIHPENWELAIEIGMPFEESRNHPLLPYMDGSPSEDGWLYSLYYDGTLESFEGVLYEVGGYQIEALTNGQITVLSGE